MRSVQLYKQRLKRGEHFPPFLFISIINSCQLRCQGCWVDVEAPREMITLDEMNRLINDAKAHGNSYFGILGGEPFMHPQLLDILAAHPDCYFQIFHQRPADHRRVAREAAEARQRHPLISIEGTESSATSAAAGEGVLSKSLAGLRELPPQPAHHRRRHQRLPDATSASWSARRGCSN